MRRPALLFLVFLCCCSIARTQETSPPPPSAASGKTGNSTPSDCEEHLNKLRAWSQDAYSKYQALSSDLDSTEKENEELKSKAKSEDDAALFFMFAGFGIGFGVVLLIVRAVKRVWPLAPERKQLIGPGCWRNLDYGVRVHGVVGQHGFGAPRQSLPNSSRLLAPGPSVRRDRILVVWEVWKGPERGRLGISCNRKIVSLNRNVGFWQA
jgi:hypothetical protein